jgi:cell division protein FtsI (penicillin-binding protein 3)
MRDGDSRVSRPRRRFQRLSGASLADALGTGRSRHRSSATRHRAPVPTAAARRTRAAMLVVAVIAGFLGLAARCIHLQIFRAEELVALARAQQERAITLDPRRGPIYDRNGNALALSIDADSVYADPSQIADPAAAAKRLAPVLGMRVAEVRERLDSDRHFVWLRRKIDPDLRRRIETLDIRGIAFTGESRRVYPKGDLAAHVLGGCGVDNQGLGGLESAYNDRFTGTPGRLEFVRDGRGDRVLYHTRVEPVPGEGLVLTLDGAIQHIAERELDVAMRETGAAGAALVAMRPQTGEILALASRPVFNPNAYSAAREETRRNRAVADFYEPGSTFKVITAAAALDAGKVRPNEVIYCENGSYLIGRRRLREDRLPFGDLTFTEVLAKSSNIGTAKVVQRMPSSAFLEAIRRFGFGRASALELPGESPGLLRPLEAWSGFSQVSISIGQEVGVTPIQLAAAMGAIANDGVYNPPFAVQAFVPPDGARVEPDRPADFGPRRAVSARAAQTLRHMLQSVTEDGTGMAARVPGYSSAGKTGTAQKIDPRTRRYARGRYVAWFAGFVPALRPELVLVVMVDEPRGMRTHGGDVSAPVFARVAGPVLEYLGVPPDVDGTLVIDRPLIAAAPAAGRSGTGRPAPAAERRTPGSTRGGARAAARTQADGAAAVVPALASILGIPLPAGASAPPATPPGTMPDVTGLSLRQAIETLAGLGLNCATERGGPRVSRQVPPPGTPVTGKTRCALISE